MADAKVDWYKADLMAAVEGATQDGLAALAFHIEGLAKMRIQANGQIDTGFMLNSVYALSETGSNHAQTQASGQYTSGKTGRSVERRQVGQAALGDASAAVHVAAEYAIYQEIDQPFLYPATVEGIGDAAATMEPVYRDRLGS